MNHPNENEIATLVIWLHRVVFSPRRLGSNQGRAALKKSAMNRTNATDAIRACLQIEAKAAEICGIREDLATDPQLSFESELGAAKARDTAEAALAERKRLEAATTTDTTEQTASKAA